RQISQYDQDIACGQLKSDRNPSKNRTQTSRLRQRSANFSSLLGHLARDAAERRSPWQQIAPARVCCRLSSVFGCISVVEIAKGPQQ
ncbi:hypothetical protein, partial [Rhizobium ruizarguesonis]|uniref:hypothetical protein n=2 Tax=Rhizobium TaxID=379 RepID=UPI001A8F4665